VFPRRGARVWYDDQREAHRQIYAGDDVVDYQFMGTDPNSPDNRWLLNAMQQQNPVTISSAVRRSASAHHSRRSSWDGTRRAYRQLAFGALVGASVQAALPASPERRYALREIKARLHQASFRDAVLSAYRGRCAISHIPEPRLLDAAHIVMDADEQLGQPVVSNGLPLTKLHHAAFDAHLIGIVRISASMSLTGCWKFMRARFSNSASRGSPEHRSTGRNGLRIVPIATGWPYVSSNSSKPHRFEPYLEYRRALVPG